MRIVTVRFPEVAKRHVKFDENRSKMRENAKKLRPIIIPETLQNHSMLR
jgi:hypothetical protein